MTYRLDDPNPSSYRRFNEAFDFGVKDGTTVFALVTSAHPPMNWRKRKKLIRKGVIKQEWIEATLTKGG